MFNSCKPTYHYHPFSVYNISLPENVTYEVIYDLLNDYQVNTVKNITEWIKEDLELMPTYIQTERPDMTTNNEIVDVGSTGTK